MEMTLEQKRALAKTRARAALQAEKPDEMPVYAGMEDIARSGAAGVGRGTIGIAGMPGDVAEVLTEGAYLAADKMGLMTPEQIERDREITRAKGKLPTSADLISAASDFIRPAPTLSQVITGDKPQTFLEYKPQSRLGRFAQTAGEFAPGVVAGPGGWITKAATTVGGAGLSEGAGQLAEGTALEPYVRLGGAVMGSLAGHRLSYRPTEVDLIRRNSPNDLTDFLALGDNAMVLDASPSMVGLAQGIASTPGAQKNLLVQALRDREMGRSDRLLADVRQSIGPGQDAGLMKQRLQESAQQQAGPMYERALTNAPQLPVTSNPTVYGPPGLNDVLAEQLTSPASAMSMNARNANRGIMDELDDALAAGTPELTARRLHDIRKRLDAQIVYDPRSREALSSADKANQEVLRNARISVDNVLKRVPGFAEADEVVAHSKRLQDDIDYGQSSLEGGKYATTTDRFSRDMRDRNPQAVGAGMRHDINVAMGTQTNDLPALRKKVGGDNDFNRDKLAQIFGQEAVDRMAGGVRREETFSRNYADIDRNSQTYQRKEAADVVRGSEPPRITGQETISGLGLKGLAAVVNSVVRGASNASRQPARDALVRALVTRGADAERLLRAARNAPSPAGGAVVKALVNALLSSTEARISGGAGR